MNQPPNRLVALLKAHDEAAAFLPPEPGSERQILVDESPGTIIGR
jgi:hypothetical protein